MTIQLLQISDCLECRAFFKNLFIYFNWRIITTLLWVLPYIDPNKPHVSPHPEYPSNFPPHPIPIGCPRASALSALLHASNLPWSSILHMVIYMFQCILNAILSNHSTPTFSYIVQVYSSHLCLLPPCI